MSSAYRVIVVRSTPRSSSRRDSWRPRSGRKLKKIGAVGGGLEAWRGRKDDRLDELVGRAALVARGDGRDRVGGALALAVEDRRAPRARCARPGCRGPSRSSGRRPSRCAPPEVAPGRATAAWGETSRPSVNAWTHVRVGHPLPLGELEEREQVVDVRVDAALRDEAHAGARRRRAPSPCANARAEHRVLEQRAVADRDVDAHQVLEQDPARADREMADLRVAHLPVGQPDGLTRRRERRVREARPRERRRPASRRARLRSPARPGRGPSRRGSRALREGSCDPTQARERSGVERGAADQRAVDVRPAEELGGVVGLDRAAVEHARLVRAT